jgi:hypothetical protein
MVYESMAKKRTPSNPPPSAISEAAYDDALAGISGLLERARHSAAQTLNAILTATYWEVGRRIVELEQSRAAYGEKLWKRLAEDLTARHGRGFSKSNLALMRAFYLHWEIFQTVSGKWLAQAKGSPFAQLADDREKASDSATPVLKPDIGDFAGAFRLPWSHYVQLLAVESKRPANNVLDAVRGFEHRLAQSQKVSLLEREWVSVRE